MKFFALDLHIGIRDIQHVFEQLGHTLDVWSISDHHHIMSWQRAQVDVVNQYTWRDLTPERIEAFYQRYKDELKDYDGFITFYPPAFSLLYEKFNKPIIMHVPIRYEVPFSRNPIAWNGFNDWLRRGVDSGQIIPLVNNKYDQEYLKVFTKRNWDLIPSLCEYTGAQYTGKKNEFLYHSKFAGFKNFIKAPNILEKKPTDWQDLADLKAIISVPYSNTLMSVFEWYNQASPMLFPSKDFLLQLWQGYRNQGVMSELTWNRVEFTEPGSAIKCDGLDPNQYRDEKSFKHWLNFCDFYDEEWMPHIEHFDSPSELEYKLNTLDFQEISDKMKAFNIKRKERILAKWQQTIEKIS